MDCSITTAGSFGVGSSGLPKHSVAGGRMTVTFGSPPFCSQAPVQSLAVEGPHPATSGRKPDPVPGYWGPVVVGVPPGPTVGLVQTLPTHRPLAQSVPALQGDPLG